MPKRKTTKADKERFALIHKYPCLLFSKWGHECGGGVTVFHFNGIKYKGMAQKSDHALTIPICKAHHIDGPNSYGRMGKQSWERRYGTQEELLERFEELRKTANLWENE